MNGQGQTRQATPQWAAVSCFEDAAQSVSSPLDVEFYTVLSDHPAAELIVLAAKRHVEGLSDRVLASADHANA
jgi:hypothetical protein